MVQTFQLDRMASGPSRPGRRTPCCGEASREGAIAKRTGKAERPDRHRPSARGDHPARRRSHSSRSFEPCRRRFGRAPGAARGRVRGGPATATE